MILTGNKSCSCISSAGKLIVNNQAHAHVYMVCPLFPQIEVFWVFANLLTQFVRIERKAIEEKN